MNCLDVGYTNGVIAAREKYLLKDKLIRLCELTAEDAFRALVESGFGGGAETAISVHDYEKLIAEEERRLDAFIREYAPSKAERAYLLAPRDFHNAKALVKAAYLGVSPERMLAPAGEVEIELLSDCIEQKKYDELTAKNEFLAKAIEEAFSFEELPLGTEIGDIFEKATYEYLRKVSKKNVVLKKLLQAKADMTNLLTAVRSENFEEAKKSFLLGGSVTEEMLATLFGSDREQAEGAFKNTAYQAFVKACLDARAQGLPLTEAERIRDGYDARFFESRKYELERNEPFLYYVYRRRNENTNVRIVFVCLLAGMSETEIKKRLRIW